MPGRDNCDWPAGQRQSNIAVVPPGMELKEVQVGDWYMKYDDATCYQGVRYLLDDLSWDERKVFFDQAYAKGAAQFEDDEDRQFTLYYQNGGYLLTRRNTSNW